MRKSVSHIDESILRRYEHGKRMTDDRLVKKIWEYGRSLEWERWTMQEMGISVNAARVLTLTMYF